MLAATSDTEISTQSRSVNLHVFVDAERLRRIWIRRPRVLGRNGEAIVAGGGRVTVRSAVVTGHADVAAGAKLIHAGIVALARVVAAFGLGNVVQIHLHSNQINRSA